MTQHHFYRLYLEEEHLCLPVHRDRKSELKRALDLTLCKSTKLIIKSHPEAVVLLLLFCRNIHVFLKYYSSMLGYVWQRTGAQTKLKVFNGQCHWVSDRKKKTFCCKNMKTLVFGKLKCTEKWNYQRILNKSGRVFTKDLSYSKCWVYSHVLLFNSVFYIVVFTHISCKSEHVVWLMSQTLFLSGTFTKSLESMKNGFY